MAFDMVPADCPDDLPEITRLLYTAFENPLQKHFLIYHPIFGSDAHARDRAIESSTQRQIRRNANDPTERWIKVTDRASGKIVAAAAWNFYDDDPYRDWKPLDVFWWPEGPLRDYVNQYFRLHDEPLVELSARPHVMLKILFTHPDHRGKGLATRLMRRGMQEADARSQQLWLTSWGLATPFYTHLGFETRRQTRVQPVWRGDDGEQEPPREWRELDARVQPATAYTQMRPRRGEGGREDEDDGGDEKNQQ